MLQDLFKSILSNKGVFLSANDGKRFEDKIRNKLRIDFSEIKKDDIYIYEGIDKKDANRMYTDLKEKIINKTSIEIQRNPFKKIANCFIFQPYGSQNFPDFLIILDEYIIPLEIKFSTNDSVSRVGKNSRPVWNSNLPKYNALYIYGASSFDITFFKGSDILPIGTRDLLLGFWDRLTEGDLNNLFLKDIAKMENPFGFYPYIRKAYEQKASVATYRELIKGEDKIGIESFFSENATKREQNVIDFLDSIERGNK